jgi:hypothetical protein
MFGSSAYTITNDKHIKNAPVPEHLDARIHPGRLVFTTQDKLNKNDTIDVSDLTVLDVGHICAAPNFQVMNECAQTGYGKIQQHPVMGKVVQVYQLSYTKGLDVKDTYWMKARMETGEKKELLIPVSYMNFSDGKYPDVHNASLPMGTSVAFTYTLEISSGKPLAANIRLVTFLNSRNMFGTPARRVETIMETQPNGYIVDTHLHPFPIIYRPDRNDLLQKHIADVIVPSQTETIHKIYIHFVDEYYTLTDLNNISITSLASWIEFTYQKNWQDASLDQMVEAFVYLKQDDELTKTFLNGDLSVTLVYTLTNHNYFLLAAQQIQNSFNKICQAGHKHLSKETGVVILYAPVTHSPVGKIAQVNSSQLLSKTACSSLKATHTYRAGYKIPYTYGPRKKGMIEETTMNLSLVTYSDNAIKGNTLN